MSRVQAYEFQPRQCVVELHNNVIRLGMIKQSPKILQFTFFEFHETVRYANWCLSPMVEAVHNVMKFSTSYVHS